MTAYQVQYWNNATWLTIPDGSVSGNNKVWRKFTFAAITTTKIRILASASPDGYSRIVELEAWTGPSRMIFDQTGNLVNTKRHNFLPFGEELFAPVGGRSAAQGYAGGDGVRQQFTLKERDVETGLDYFLARYYSSSQGRFSSIDPENYQARLDLSDPQSWNAYSYVNNNPLQRVDPDGKGFFSKLRTGFCGTCGVKRKMLKERKKSDAVICCGMPIQTAE